MRPFFIIPILIFFLQQVTAQNKKGKNFEIQVELANAKSDSIAVFDMMNNDILVLYKVPLKKEGDKAKALIKGQVPAEGMYLVGMDAQKAKLVVITEQSSLKFTADESYFAQTAVVTGSPVNEDYNIFNSAAGEIQGKIQTAQSKFQQTKDPLIRAELDSLYQVQTEMQTKYLVKKDILSKIVQFYYFPAYKPSEHTKYKSEIEYFIGEFMNLPFQDTTMAYFPMYSEKLMYYSRTVAQLLSFEEAKTKLIALTQKPQPNTKLHKITFLTMLQGLQQSQPDMFAEIGEQYLKFYPNGYKSAQIKEVVNRISALKIGGLAPEIVMKDTAGVERKLSSLRGKVVLIDFWASWCGPCRKENPNVVKAYQEFNKKGFEVFSVSLDNPGAKDRWINAIKQDGLIWPNHVSDLAGWQSVACKLYNFNSIPFTVLLDKQGKIVAKNLRGPKLEEELKKLLP